MRTPVAVSTCFAWGVVCGAVGGSVRLAAHHSCAAEFDDTTPLKVTGTITNVEWKNCTSGFT